MTGGQRAGIASALGAFSLALSLAATSVAIGHPYELAFSLLVYLLVMASSYLMVRSAVPPRTEQRRLQVYAFAMSAALSLGGAAWAFGPGSLGHPSWKIFGPYCVLVALPLLTAGHLLFHAPDDDQAMTRADRLA